ECAPLYLSPGRRHGRRRARDVLGRPDVREASTSRVTVATTRRRWRPSAAKRLGRQPWDCASVRRTNGTDIVNALHGLGSLDGSPALLRSRPPTCLVIMAFLFHAS